MGRNKETQKPPKWSYPIVIIIIAVYFVNDQYGTAIVQWWENYGVALILTIILAVGLIISWRVGLFEILLEYVDNRKSKELEDKWRREGKEFVFDYPGKEKWLTKEQKGMWEATKNAEKAKEEEKWKTDLGKIIQCMMKCTQLKRWKVEEKYQLTLAGALQNIFSEIDWEGSKGIGRPDITIKDEYAIEVKGPTNMKDLRGGSNSVDSKIGKYLSKHKYMIVILYDIVTDENNYDGWEEGFLGTAKAYKGRLHLIKDTSKFGDHQMELVTELPQN